MTSDTGASSAADAAASGTGRRSWTAPPLVAKQGQSQKRLTKPATKRPKLALKLVESDVDEEDEEDEDMSDHESGEVDDVQGQALQLAFDLHEMKPTLGFDELYASTLKQYVCRRFRIRCMRRYRRS